MTGSVRNITPSGRVRAPLAARGIVWLGAALVVLVVMFFALDSVFGYAMYRIEANQVGVKFRASQPYKVVGPGVWTELGLWEDIKPVNITGLPFTVLDPEVLTKDQQRLGIEIAGTVHRPGLDKADILIANWANYSTF